MKLALFAVFLFCCSIAHAQNQKSTIAHKISYQLALPKAISKMIPHSAKSCFFGKFRLQEGGIQYALHLFKAHPKQGLAYGDSNSTQHFTLDVFQVGLNNNYRRVNRVPFNYESFTRGHSKFGCQWFWVDANKNEIPVLQFKIWDSKGADFPGMGDDVFASFDNDLTHMPVIQSFTMGRWIASDASGEDNFVNRDANGIAEITARIYDTNAFIEPTDSKFKWNGKRFEPTAPLNEQQQKFFHWDN